MNRIKDKAATIQTSHTVPFPPLPVATANPAKQPVRVFPFLFIGGVLGVIALLVWLVPWRVLSQNTLNTVEGIGEWLNTVQLPNVSAPPQNEVVEVPSEPVVATVPEPPPDVLVLRYPARRYTDMELTVRPGNGLYAFVRQYGSQIYPKKYRDYRQLAQYNGVRPPGYVLEVGQVFRIPTMAHIIAPKTGYEAELKEVQAKLESQWQDVGLLNQLAMLHFKRNELDLAQKTLEQAIKLSPDNGVLYNNLGVVYLMVEEDDLAATAFERAVAQTERPAIPRNNQAVLYLEAGKPELALTTLEATAQTDKNFLDAKFNLAIAREKVGRQVEAVQQLDALRELLPKDPDIQSALERMRQ